jgi:DNA-binding HxlR family transcriptional regulator
LEVTINKFRTIDWVATNAACEALPPKQDELARELVSRMGEKWTLWTLSVLDEAAKPLRFSRVMEHVERDGMVTRTVFAEVPPRVEYAITPIGHEILEQVHPLWIWTVKNVARFELYQERYDALR